MREILFKIIILPLLLITSDALANINYCAIDNNYASNCDNYRRSIPFLGRRVDGGEFIICCYQKETYDQFVKIKSK